MLTDTDTGTIPKGKGIDFERNILWATLFNFHVNNYLVTSTEDLSATAEISDWHPMLRVTRVPKFYFRQMTKSPSHQLIFGFLIKILRSNNYLLAKI